MKIYEPKITAVSITPNPVSINANFAIAVSVIEVEVIMYKVSAVSGALKSGQTINLSTRKEVS